HLAKADGKLAEVGESLDFQVLEFSKDDKKIVVSHTKMHSEVAEDAKEMKKKAAAKSAKTPKPEIEKSTLGDIEALSNLKASGDAAAKEEVEKKAKAKKAKKEESEE